MLDLLKNIWKRDNQSINIQQVKRDSLKREKDAYELEISLKVYNDPDYKDLVNTIQEKEREVTKLLNALDTLYTCRETTTQSLEEKFKEETPFSKQEEWDEEFQFSIYGGLTGHSGLTGYTGPIGPLSTATYPVTPINTYNSINSNSTSNSWPGKKKQ